MKWPGLRNLDGNLPVKMENEYRQHYLRMDTQVASVSMIFLSIFLVALAYNDYLLFGFGTLFYTLVSIRLSYFIYFIVLFIYLRKNTIPPKFDNHVFALLMVGVVIVSLINITRPADYTGYLVVDIVIILLVYMGVPMKLLYRVVGAAIFTLVEILVLFIFKQVEVASTIYTAIIALFMANVVGIFGSSLLYSFRRSEYRQRMEKQEIADQWQETFNSITDLISIQDTDCRLIRVNKAYADAFNMRPGELEGKKCYQIVHKTDCPMENCPHIQTLNTQASTTEEIFEPTLGLFLEITTSPIFDSKDKLIYTVHLAKDVTERKKMEGELEQMATHDGLTGLPNRKLLNDRFNIAAASAERENKKLALMVMDLDKFKLINDTYGHGKGDMLLKEVATRLSNGLRRGDTIARIGGDEFVVLLPEVTNARAATVIAKKIIQLFAGPFVLDGDSVNVTTSIGIDLYPDNGKAIDELLNKADIAMYSAKESGGNSYRLFEVDQPA